MKAISLHVGGIVQGVGFRPHVYRLARELALRGHVLNDASGVHIDLYGEPTQLARFIEQLRQCPPPLARIDFIHESPLPMPPWPPQDFEIRSSQADDKATVLVSADKSSCDACLAEIRDPEDRHFDYPFTNCTHCGPRYSLIRALPYDRVNTSMAAFAMCPECEAEYRDPMDRRYHAQPVSCPQCGPHLSLLSVSGEVLCDDSSRAMDLTADMLASGNILAIKGLGGFHLVCDANNADAVALLRQRKHRPAKPLAVMVPDLDCAKQLAIGSQEEWQLLCSREKPIVLLHKQPQQSLVCEAVAPGIDRLGLFLPYTPLHQLLLARCGFPLVATSANQSGDPIITDSEQVLARLGKVVDAVLDHNRPIVNGCDDSVVQWAGGQMQVIRLARGYAPLCLESRLDSQRETDGDWLAVGPQQKNTLALNLGSHLFLSPHIGDLFSVEAEAYFERTLATFQRLYSIAPAGIACDRHPDYSSSRWAHARAQAGQGLLPVQHHHAHVLATMAANDISSPVLGFCFDGSGLGDEGEIWGGEVLLCRPSGYQRLAHVRSFAVTGGDKVATEPWRVLLGLLAYELIDDSIHALKLPALERLGELQRANLLRLTRSSRLKCSSMGRLFDAAAALLGFEGPILFEGQAGLFLEALAAKSQPKNGSSNCLRLAITPDDKGFVLDGHGLILAMIDALRAGTDVSAEQLKADLARQFILALSQAVLELADHYPDLPVVLSGGVFQNRTLADACVAGLQQRGRTLLPWGQVPVNDGGIALGQLWAALHGNKGESLT
ncbi:carbamoyltransferase HypF [Shewanella cyperi]|uniref:Carbamoyltransferase HypF n=1 Tax=Shewanella cyperi TaxID=2814292 RepID=A0A974XHH8_9GAMM|nr:carbamoyltransferase HypF [Shewanella cyperi]QSX28505.1 carbamoyltransferase HypF [Shewanella cyperi]